MHLTIDWLNFAPGSALIGGLMLGVGTSLLLIFNGKIAGISGIAAYLVNPNNIYGKEAAWRGFFLLGLIGAGLVYSLFAALPPVSISANNNTLIMAGLLVGFGSRMGSGCTSGHGICGLSRLSLRSLVATLSFMLAGFAVTYAMLHGS
ncbi:MAG: YeeE/YedE family protein [Methylotenera sp.]|nr:YeeE/YedE family protein [Methylotenera sp.]